jgi:murein DD-endopeptidase MepM/ murein hydrolase activator NlpD
MHIGQDLMFPVDGPVYAVADGVVVRNNTGGWGSGIALKSATP